MKENKYFKKSQGFEIDIALELENLGLLFFREFSIVPQNYKSLLNNAKSKEFSNKRKK